MDAQGGVGFLDYDYADGSNGAFVEISGPSGKFPESGVANEAVMLPLPDGTLLYGANVLPMHTYKPVGSPYPGANRESAALLKPRMEHFTCREQT